MTAYTLAFVLIRVLAIYFFLLALSSLPFALFDTSGTGMTLGRLLERFYGFFPLLAYLGLWFGGRKIATFLISALPSDGSPAKDTLDVKSIATLLTGLLGLWLFIAGIREAFVAGISTANAFHLAGGVPLGWPYEFARMWTMSLLDFVIGVFLLWKSRTLGRFLSSASDFTDRIRSLGVEDRKS